MTAPQTIILDAHGWFQRLRGQQALYQEQYASCQSEMFVTDLAAEVVEHIRDRRRAEYELRNLCSEIGAKLCHAGADLVPPMMAPVVFQFGMDLIRQLDEARAYLPNGTLPYHFHLLPRPQDNVTVILQRTNELPR